MPLAIFSRPFFEQKSRAFWMLQAAGWSGYLVLRTVSSLSNGLSVDTVVAITVESIVGYCITLLLSTLYGTYRGMKRITAIPLAIATLAAATVLYAILDAFTFSFIKLATPGIDLGLLFGTIFLNFTVLAGWSALYFGINFYLIVEEQIDQMQVLEFQASSAQLAMLRYQLNPHFLFNTLNSISTLVLLKQTDRANVMLSRLSSFLRYTLANEPTASVTLAQEVETLKLYLEIEKMRFESRLRPSFDIDPRALKARPAQPAAPAVGRERDQICGHATGRRRRNFGRRAAERGPGADHRFRHRAGLERSAQPTDLVDGRGARQHSGSAGPGIWPGPPLRNPVGSR